MALAKGMEVDDDDDDNDWNIEDDYCCSICWDIFKDLSKYRFYSQGGIPTPVLLSELTSSLNLHSVFDEELRMFIFRAVRLLDIEFLSRKVK